jgi:hypothetical protein
VRFDERSCYREGLDDYDENTGAEKKTGGKKKIAVGSRASNASSRVDKKQAEIVQKLLTKMEQKLAKDEVKASLADYIRLVQLQKELEADEPREIRVQWVDSEMESTNPDTKE